MAEQQLYQTLLQNGSVVGLKLTGSIVNVVNNIDEELKRKADNDDIEAVRKEVQLKPSIDDVKTWMKTVTTHYDDIVDDVKRSVNEAGITAISERVDVYDTKITTCEVAVSDLRTAIDEGLKSKTNFAEYAAFVGEMNNGFQRVNSDLRSLKELLHRALLCNDYVLSDPPTLEELTEINKMNLGSFYTINGGNVMLVFRKPYALPLVKSPPAVF